MEIENKTKEICTKKRMRIPCLAWVGKSISLLCSLFSGRFGTESVMAIKRKQPYIGIFFSSSFWIHGMFYMICICCIHTNGNIISILSYILIHLCECHLRRNIYRNKKGSIAQTQTIDMKYIFFIQKRLWTWI